MGFSILEHDEFVLSHGLVFEMLNQDLSDFSPSAVPEDGEALDAAVQAALDKDVLKGIYGRCTVYGCVLELPEPGMQPAPDTFRFSGQRHAYTLPASVRSELFRQVPGLEAEADAWFAVQRDGAGLRGQKFEAKPLGHPMHNCWLVGGRCIVQGLEYGMFDGERGQADLKQLAYDAMCGTLARRPYGDLSVHRFMWSRDPGVPGLFYETCSVVPAAYLPDDVREDLGKEDRYGKLVR